MEDDPIRIPITDVFDLHSVPPRDVEPIVEGISGGSATVGIQGFTDYSRPRDWSAARNRTVRTGQNPFCREFWGCAGRSRRLGSDGSNIARSSLTIEPSLESPWGRRPRLRRTPRSGFAFGREGAEADVGVGRSPGGLPHFGQVCPQRQEIQGTQKNGTFGRPGLNPYQRPRLIV